MRKRLYTVFDILANTTVGGIVQEMHDAPAIRAFSDALGNKESILAAHPADYELRYLGEIETDGGMIYPTLPETIITGKLWKEMNDA